MSGNLVYHYANHTFRTSESRTKLVIGKDEWQTQINDHLPGWQALYHLFQRPLTSS